MEDLGKSTLWLQAKLASPSPHLHILDCRSRELYDLSHVERALSVALPGLLLRRLRKGNLSIRSLLPAPPQDLEDNMVLLYDERTLQLTQSREQEEDEESVLMTLLQKLREEGSPAYYLQGRCAGESGLCEGQGERKEISYAESWRLFCLLQPSGSLFLCGMVQS